MVGRIRTLIVDDEPSSRRAMEILLADIEDVEVVATAGSGRAAVELIRGTRPELVFLDVQMPELDGFDVLEEVGAADLPRIVFVTAHDEFAARAFEVNAVDYLLKPVDDRKLERALERVRRDRQEEGREGMAGGARGLLEHLHEGPGPRPAPYKKRLLVKHRGEYIFVQAEDVEWLEAEGNYVRVHADAGSHLIRASLTELDSMLDPERFLRVHRGSIVNLDRVTSIQPDGVSDYRILLRSGRIVKVGRTYRDAILHRRP